MPLSFESTDNEWHEENDDARIIFETQEHTNELHNMEEVYNGQETESVEGVLQEQRQHTGEQFFSW